MLTFITLTVEDPCNNPVYDSLKEDVDIAQKLICDKVISTNPKIKIYITINLTLQTTAIVKLEGTLKKQFDYTKGVLFSTLDKSLQQLHVQRQAYHEGGTFVGNHVHKLLQVTAIIFLNLP